MTQAAVETMQQENGLSVTGKVDNELMSKLINGEINAKDPYSTLKQGDNNEQVVAMQKRLQELGYLTGKADGIYGNGTKNAVSAFQLNNGLEATGIADRETQAVMFAEDAKKKEN